MGLPYTSFLASESLPLEAVDREEAVRLINLGRRFLSPLPLENGAFYFPQGGLYQLFAGPSGERVGIWAQNPDDLELETVMVDEALSKTLTMRVGEGDEAKDVPVPVGTKLPARIKDKGNGNIGRLRVFSLKPKAMEKKWLREEIARHQHAFQSFTETYGTLFRQSQTLWVSDGIIYQALPSKKVEGRYDLMMTSAPAHGWTLGRDFEKIFSGLSGKFLRAASPRACGLTLEEIEKIVPEDFLKRARLFVEGADPYAVMLNGKDNGNGKVPFKYKIRKMGTRVAYALAQLRGMRVMGRLGIVTLVNGFIAALAYVALGSPITPFWMLRIAGQTAGGTGKEMMEYLRIRKMQIDNPEVESLLTQYTQDFNHMKIWGGCLRPEMATYLTALNHEQLNTDLNPGEQILKEIPQEEAALEYIAGATEGPIGSPGAFFKIGEYTGLRVYEPNGLNVEYIPELGISYATMDWSKFDATLLPAHVTAFMRKRQAEGASHIKVSYDKANRRMVYKAMTKEDYFADFDNIRTRKYEHPLAISHEVNLTPPPRPEPPSSLFTRLVRDGMDSVTAGGQHIAEQVWKIIKGPGPN